MTIANKKNLVENWFGDAFFRLDPLLQQLHKTGGKLSGRVQIQYGHGVAGFLGRRIARKMGIPLESGDVDFEVDISHTNSELIWSRTFNHNHKMTSVFIPVGHFSDGYWIEKTGKLKIELGVDIIDGGWYWLRKRIKLGQFSLPASILPKTQAYKKIVDGQYEFCVAFSMQGIGNLVSYAGKLHALPD